MEVSTQESCEPSLVGATNSQTSAGEENQTTEPEKINVTSEPANRVIKPSMLKRCRSAYSCLPVESGLYSIPEHKSLEQTTGIPFKIVPASGRCPSTDSLSFSSLSNDTEILFHKDSNKDEEAEEEKPRTPFEKALYCLSNDSNVDKDTNKFKKSLLLKRHTFVTLPREIEGALCKESLLQEMVLLNSRKNSVPSDFAVDEERCRVSSASVTNTTENVSTALPDTNCAILLQADSADQISDTKKTLKTEGGDLRHVREYTDSDGSDKKDIILTGQCQQIKIGDGAENKNSSSLEDESNRKKLMPDINAPLCLQKRSESIDHYKTVNFSHALTGTTRLAAEEDEVNYKSTSRRHSFESLYQSPFCYPFNAEHSKKSKDPSVLKSNVFERGFNGIHKINKDDFNLKTTQFSVTKFDLKNITEDLKMKPKNKNLKLPIARGNSDSCLDLSKLKHRLMNREEERTETSVAVTKTENMNPGPETQSQSLANNRSNVISIAQHRLEENRRNVSKYKFHSQSESEHRFVEKIKKNCTRITDPPQKREEEDDTARKCNQLKRLLSETDLKDKPNKHFRHDSYQKTDNQIECFPCNAEEEKSIKAKIPDGESLQDMVVSYNLLNFFITKTGEGEFATDYKPDLPHDSNLFSGSSVTDSKETEHLNDSKSDDKIQITIENEEQVVRFRVSPLRPKVALSIKKKKQFFRSKSVENAFRIWGLVEANSVGYTRSLSEGTLKLAYKHKMKNAGEGTTELKKSNSDKLQAPMEGNIFKIWGINTALKQWKTKLSKEIDYASFGGQKPNEPIFNIPTVCKMFVFLKKWQKRSHREMDANTDYSESKVEMKQQQPFSCEKPMGAAKTKRMLVKSSKKSVYEIVINLIMRTYFQTCERDFYRELSFRSQRTEKDRKKPNEKRISEPKKCLNQSKKRTLTSTAWKSEVDSTTSFEIFDNVSFHIRDDGTPVLQKRVHSTGQGQVHDKDVTARTKCTQESQEIPEGQTKCGSIENSNDVKEHLFEERKNTKLTLKHKSKSRTELVNDTVPYNVLNQGKKTNVIEEERFKLSHTSGIDRGLGEMIDACGKLTEAKVQESFHASRQQSNEVKKQLVKAGKYQGSLDDIVMQPYPVKKSSKDSLTTSENLGSKLFLNVSPADDDVFFSFGSSTISDSSLSQEHPESRKTSSEVNETIDDWKHESKELLTTNKEEATSSSNLKSCKSSTPKKSIKSPRTGLKDVPSIDYLLCRFTGHNKCTIKSNATLQENLDPVDRRLIRRTSSDAGEGNFTTRPQKVNLRLIRRSRSAEKCIDEEVKKYVVPETTFHRQSSRSSSHSRCESDVMEHMRDSKVFPLIATQPYSESITAFETDEKSMNKTNNAFEKTKIDCEKLSPVICAMISKTDTEEREIMPINCDFTTPINVAQPEASSHFTSSSVDCFTGTFSVPSPDQTDVHEERMKMHHVGEYSFLEDNDMSNIAGDDHEREKDQQKDPDLDSQGLDANINKDCADQFHQPEINKTVKVCGREERKQAASLSYGRDPIKVCQDIQKIKNLKARQDDRPQLPLLQSRQNVALEPGESLPKTDYSISMMGSDASVSPLCQSRSTRRFYTLDTRDSVEERTSLEAFLNVLKCCWICKGDSNDSDNESNDIGNSATKDTVTSP